MSTREKVAFGNLIRPNNRLDTDIGHFMIIITSAEESSSGTWRDSPTIRELKQTDAAAANRQISIQIE